MNQMHANGNRFRSDIENTGNKISNSVTQQIANAKNAVDKTTKQLEQQIRDSLERLGKILA